MRERARLCVSLLLSARPCWPCCRGESEGEVRKKEEEGAKHLGGPVPLLFHPAPTTDPGAPPLEVTSPPSGADHLIVLVSNSDSS